MLGQQVSARREERTARSAELLNQLSILIALSEDYRNRVWEERNGLSDRSVSDWDMAGYRRAQARVKLLVRDEAVLRDLRRLESSGQALGKEWRLGKAERPELEQTRKEHRSALDTFLVTARDLVGSDVTRLG